MGRLVGVNGQQCGTEMVTFNEQAANNHNVLPRRKNRHNVVNNEYHDNGTANGTGIGRRPSVAAFGRHATNNGTGGSGEENVSHNDNERTTFRTTGAAVHQGQWHVG